MLRHACLGKVVVALAAAVLIAGCQNSALIQENAASARSPFIGTPAPDFTLPDQNGQAVALSGLHGQWVVLYFYPKDDTPACTCEATEFTKLMGDFHGMEAKVFGISADSSQTHKLFVDKYKLALTLLSDPNHKVMREYGAWVDTPKGPRVIRSTFIVGPDGVIRWHWPEVIPTGHAERVAHKLAELQAKYSAGTR